MKKKIITGITILWSVLVVVFYISINKEAAMILLSSGFIFKALYLQFGKNKDI